MNNQDNPIFMGDELIYEYDDRIFRCILLHQTMHMHIYFRSHSTGLSFAITQDELEAIQGLHSYSSIVAWLINARKTWSYFANPDDGPWMINTWTNGICGIPWTCFDL